MLARERNWSDARIGAFLGITRARVGQKMRQYERYANRVPHKMPTVAEIMRQDRPKPPRESALVAFKQEDWEREDFALEVLRMLVSLR